MRTTGTDPDEDPRSDRATPTVPDRFEDPREVLAAADLDRAEKREILEAWRLDAARLADSSAEGMAGGEPSMLRRVELALAELDGDR